MYIKNSQDKADPGSAQSKMLKRIKRVINIVTVINGPTSLVSVVNSSYY